MKQKLRPLEVIMNVLFFLCGFIAVVFVLFISVYLIISGLPAIKEIGLVDFLFGTTWASTASEPSFGILPFILTSIYGTAGAIVLGGGLLAAYNTESFGFDGQNPVIGADEEKFFVLGAEIPYDALEKFGERFVYTTAENTYVCLV